MIDSIQIDRLVDDELGDAERSDLLKRLDKSPDGWKRCALAFLEAQAFRDASHSWTLAIAPEQTPPRSRAPRLGRVAFLAQLAAAAMLAVTVFVSGYAIGQRDTSAGTSTDVNSSVKTAEPTLPAPTVASVLQAWEAQPAAVPDYVRSHWEREGYQIEEERKVMAMDLGDGRRVVFPVDDVRVQYVGRTTY